MSTRERTTWLDAARGLAIALVVLLHSSEWLATARFGAAAWLPFHTVVTGVRIPLFFAVSGLLAQRWRTAGWRELFSGRLLLLIWVYLLWQVVGSGSALVAAQITGDRLTAPRMAVSLAAAVVRPRFELWFLWALVVFLVLARATARVPVKVQLLVAALFSAVFFSSLVPVVNLGWNGVPSCYVFFLIGLHGRDAILGFAQRLSPMVAGAVIAGWVALAVLVLELDAGGVVGVGFVVRAAGLAAGISLAVLLSSWTALRSLGAQTLPVYVAHTPIIVLVVWGLSAFAGDLGAVAGVIPPVLALFAILGSLAVHRILVRVGAGWAYTPPAWVVAQVRPRAPRMARHVADRNPPREPVLGPAPAPAPAETPALAG